MITSARTNAAGFQPLTQTILDVYSKDILFHAQPVLRFEQFAK